MADSESGGEFSLEDVRSMNLDTQAYVRGLGGVELNDRLDEIRIPRFGDESLLPRASDALKRNGIVIFDNVIEPSQCDAAKQAIETLCQDYQQRGQEVFEDERALYQLGSGKLKGYYQLSHYNKAVITVRQGADQGMIDIFNCDFALPTELEPMKQVLGSEYLLRVIDSKGLQPQNLNAYLNQSVSHTRGFHVDSYAEHLKAFIYLTDVGSLEDGPYTYVKGSHLPSPMRRLNEAVGKTMTPRTETPLVQRQEISPILAPRGSLVISDQSGSHRGWPQQESRQRVAVVMKYAR